MPKDRIDLNALLDHITSTVYDYGHGLLGPEPSWVVDAEPLIAKIAELAEMTTEEMTITFDQARERTHKCQKTKKTK